MRPMQVLVAEDEPNLGELLCALLVDEGYRPSLVTTPAAELGVAAIIAKPYDSDELLGAVRAALGSGPRPAC